MKIKSFFVLIILFINNFILFAQAQEKEFTIKGQILNKETSLPLNSVFVKLKDSKNKILEETFTDEKGFFFFRLKKYADYFVEIIFPGFKPYHKKISLSNDFLDLEKIYLEKQTDSLEEVIVRTPAKTTIVTKIDKKVVHVGEDLLSTSTTADELLNRLPSLHVDPQNGNLSMQGDQVEVYLDGKPSNMPVSQLIKQLPVNAIEKIEIISNPSAKYEASGTGILNIILKKGSRKKGYQISLDTGNQIGRSLRFNNTLNININFGQFNFFTTYSYNPGRKNIIVKQKLIPQNQSINQNIIRNSDFHSLKYGFDYFIDKKNELTLSSTLFFDHSKGQIFKLLEDKKFHSNQTSKNKFNQFEYNFNYTHKFDKKDHQWTFDGNYSHSKNEDEFDIFIPKNKDDSKLNSQQFLVKTDYKLPISKTTQFETGGQYRRNHLKNAYKNFTFNTEKKFLSSRDIYASYFTYNKELNKFGLKLGLRGEYTLDDIENKKNKYPDLFPSVFFNYNLSKVHQFSLSYSKKIRRPSLNSISPIRRFQSDNFKFEGNPKLKSAYSHFASLSYLYSKSGNRLNFSAFYRYTSNPIVFINEIDPFNESILVGKMGNYGKSVHYGFELSGNYKIISWWNLNGSFDLYQNTQSGFMDLPPQSFIQTTLRGNNNFKLTKKLSLQLSGVYNAPQKNLQGSTKSRSSINLGLSKKILKDKGTLSLNIYDIFKQNTFRGSIETKGAKRKFYNDWETRYIALNFSYSIGGEIQKRKVENKSNEEKMGGSSIMGM